MYSVTYKYKKAPKKKRSLPPTGIRITEVDISHSSFTKDNWIQPSLPLPGGA